MSMNNKYGIKVVPRGENIDKAPPDRQTFSSQFQSPKVTEPFKGTLQLDANGNGSVPIPHTLGYSPAAFPFYKIDDGNWFPFDNLVVGLETNVRDFVVRTPEGGIPAYQNKLITYKVWLLRDPAQDIN